MGESIGRAIEHPEHVWEAQRQLFTRLYKVEKKKLLEVKRIMQDEHDFYATERQYKRRIKKWDLEKNSKASEKQHALMALKSFDSSIDMACSYKLNGKVIPAHKLLRYARSGCFETPKVVRGSITRRSHFSQFRFKGIGPTVVLTPHQRRGSIATKFTDLAELLALATCFIWFEKWDSLISVSHARSPVSLPSVGFLKWTKVILSTTQLPVNSIILATLYVYRLKALNPTVIGKPGSEYRLATIALMLSNKYLDDNTYTNKTWAEVSGITVQEINIMEIEFLSNMRYSLMVQPHSWELWIEQLAELQEFFRQSPVDVTQTIELPDLPQGNQSSVSLEVPDTEMRDIHVADISLAAHSDTRDATNFNILDFPSPEENDTSAPEMHTNVCSDETLHNGQSDLQIIPSIDEESLQYKPPSVPESERSLQSNVFQDADDMMDLVTENNSIEFVDRSFADMTFPSPPFPSILTMELPPPEPNPEDMLLEWKCIESSQLQEGPIPDLDVFLDPSLWEDGSDLLQLEWSSVLLLEQSDGASSAPAGE